MTKSKGVIWNLFDDALLREQVNSGASRKVIARHLKRSEGAVRMRAKMLRLRFPHSLRSREWTTGEDEQLRMFAASGRTTAEAAHYLDRTHSAVHSRAKRHRIRFRLHSTRNNGWNLEQDEELTMLAKKGLDKNAIAPLLTVRRTPAAIRRRANKLGLFVPHSPSGPGRRATRWTDARLKECSTLWKAGWTGEALSKKYGDVSRSSIIAKMHRLGLSRLPVHQDRLKKQQHSPRQRAQRAQFNKPKRPALRQIAPKTTKHFALGSIRNHFAKGSALPTELPMVAANDVARITRADLGPKHCRWIVGDPRNIPYGSPLFCGHQRETGLAYCAAHSRRAFNAVSEAPRQYFFGEA